MKLSKAVKPISYLKAHAAAMIREIAETGDPIVITQNGEAKAVLQSVGDYEAREESLDLLKMLGQSQKSFDEGRGIPARVAFRTLRERARADRGK